MRGLPLIGGESRDLLNKTELTKEELQRAYKIVYNYAKDVPDEWLVEYDETRGAPDMVHVDVRDDIIDDFSTDDNVLQKQNIEQCCIL